MKISLLIYDLDGTLIDSKQDIANSVNWTLTQLGLPTVSNEVVYSYVGNGVRPLIAKSVGEEGGAKFKEALKIFKTHYLEHLLDQTQLFAGVKEVLHHFKGKTQAVLTNKPGVFSLPILKGLKVDHYFSAIIGGEDGFPKKPDPAAIHHLLKEFNCPPAQAVMIGDSRVDIETGKNAGILTCGVTYGFRGEEEVHASQPDFLIAEPHEIILLFK
ncbi:MAG: HAD-IA family hydrolase [Deltaproteobacteria bacterium]|nr:HAD-IA family hydrolase [Deltaproteobacteria bacterium]